MNSISVQKETISGRHIYIVEDHHHVLVPWMDFREKSGKPFVSLTLDHHTDVLPADSRCAFDLTHDNLMKSLALLRHDEHLDWAVKSGIIERALIVSHENFTNPANPQLQVICDPDWPDSQEILNSSDKAREMASKVLESEFLTKQLSAANIPSDATLVLDIDLDYFLTAAALSPKAPELFLSLVRRSPIITISMEREWVKILRLKGENISSESILAELLQLIRLA